MTRMDNLVELGMTTNVSRFFGILFEARDVYHQAALYQKDLRLSTNLILKETHNSISSYIDRLIQGYSGLYYAPKIDITLSRVEDPIEYTKKLYSIIIESKNLFKDSWIHNLLDDISELLAITLYRLQYTK